LHNLHIFQAKLMFRFLPDRQLNFLQPLLKNQWYPQLQLCLSNGHLMLHP
jgi:hypothetical protein